MLFDIAIVGAGLVGASLARALEASGLAVAVVEAAPAAPAGEAWETRVYALSPATQRFLADIGVWQALDRERMAAVYDMRVFGDAKSRLTFSAYEAGVERLATIVEAGALQRALWSALERQPGVELVCPAKAATLVEHPGHVELGLVGGRVVATRLLVGADGAQSWVRDAAGFAVRRAPGELMGVVANFSCTRPHHGTAWQWFLDDGVLAWLPLPGEHFSMVWTTDPANADSLVGAPAEQLCERVAQAGDHALGELQLVTRAAGFPVARFQVPSRVRSRLALIGDAAHGLHPLAGQGVNLGFGDARVLAKTLMAARAGDPGEFGVLRRFERERAEAILAMRIATEGLQRLYSLHGSAAAAVRSIGLNLTDRAGVLKNVLARQAMGRD